MAYTIIGQIHRIGQTETIATQRGTTFTKRELVLMQVIYDQYTGQEKSRNFPQLEFGGNGCQLLDQFRQGDMVQVTFDVRGASFTNKEGKEAFINRLNAFRIEPYAQRQYGQQPVSTQPTMEQPQQPPQQQGQPQGAVPAHSTTSLPQQSGQNQQQVLPPQQPQGYIDPDTGLPF